MNQLNIAERKESGREVLEFSGPVNSYTFSEFQEHVYKAVKKSNVIVDMEKVSTLSSAGLGVLMAAMEDAEAAGHRLWILKPSEIVRLAIDSTGFTDRFPVIQSLKEID